MLEATYGLFHKIFRCPCKAERHYLSQLIILVSAGPQAGFLPSRCPGRRGPPCVMKAAAKEARVGVKEITSLGRGGCLEEVPPRPALIRTVDRGREGVGGGRAGRHCECSRHRERRAERHTSVGVWSSGVKRTQEDGLGLVTWPECQRSGVGVG